MKTTADLNSLIPTLVEMLRYNEHAIGESFIEQDEDGYGRSENPESNYLAYEEDGWLIEINYECSGEYASDSGDSWTPSYCELMRAWGSVTSIIATHYDSETDEDTEFSEEDVKGLWSALDEELKNIA